MSEERIPENKKLIEKYPFLLPRGWDDKVDEDYDYTYTELDAMPDGWRKAFGEMMCEEIKQELLKFGQDRLDSYRIEQIKEKYGGLRWYDNGHPVDSKIGDIIGKYETLSQNICLSCGKPDVPMIGDYWIMPLCRACYCDDGHNPPEEWDAFAKDRDSMMSDTYEYRRYSKESWIDVKIDISKTAKAIRENYWAEQADKELEKCL